MINPNEPKPVKVRHIMVRRGDLLRFYTNRRYQYSIPVMDAKNLVGAVFEALKNPKRHIGVDVTEIIETDLGENHV